MFSTPSPTQTLQARPQPPGMAGGVTPELIKLLAQMKVKQETDAAARDLAMKQGQQPPTVAQSMQQELEGSATKDVMEKLAPQGLRALAPQVGAPQGQNVQAQQAQQAAGLPGVPSNLPQSYAGGGIVAFEEGGKAEEPLSYAEQMAKLRDFFPELLYAGAKGLADVTADTYKAAKEIAPDAVANLVSAPQAQAPVLGSRPAAAPAAPPVDTSDPNFGADSKGLPAAPAAKAPPAGLPAAVSASRSASGSVRGSQGLSSLGAAPDFTPEQKARTERYEAELEKRMMADPEVAREAAAKRRAAALDPDQQASLDNQKQGLAKLQALQESNAAGRPSSLMRGLQLMGRNQHGVGLGGAFAGVSEGIDATNAGYNKEDQAFQVQVNGLQAAMDKAKQENNLGAYNAAESALKDAVAGREAATKDAVSMQNVRETAMGRKQSAWDAAKAREMAASLAYQARVDAKAAGATDNAIKLAEAAASRDPEMLSLRDLLKKMEDPTWKIMENGGRTPEQVYQRMAAITEEKYRRFGIEMPGAAPEKGAPTAAGWSAKIKT